MVRHLGYGRQPSAEIREQVEAARDRLRARFEGIDLGSNAAMGPTQIRTYLQLDEAGRELIQQAMHSLRMTARAFHRVLKLSRTIADLAGSDEIELAHLAEALQYRPRRW